MITFPRAHPDCSLTKFNSRVARAVTFIWAAVVDWLNLKLQWAPIFWLVDCFHKTRQYKFRYSNANHDLFYIRWQFNSASVRLSVTYLLAQTHTHTDTRQRAHSRRMKGTSSDTEMKSKQGPWRCLSDTSAGSLKLLMANHSSGIWHEDPGMTAGTHSKSHSRIQFLFSSPLEIARGICCSASDNGDKSKHMALVFLGRGAKCVSKRSEGTCQSSRLFIYEHSAKLSEWGLRKI